MGWGHIERDRPFGLSPCPRDVPSRVPSSCRRENTKTGSRRTTNTRTDHTMGPSARPTSDQTISSLRRRKTGGCASPGARAAIAGRARAALRQDRREACAPGGRPRLSQTQTTLARPDRPRVTRKAHRRVERPRGAVKRQNLSRSADPGTPSRRHYPPRTGALSGFHGGTPAHGTGHTLRKASVALWPPKPKEFDSAWRIAIGRGSLGT